MNELDFHTLADEMLKLWPRLGSTLSVQDRLRNAGVSVAFNRIFKSRQRSSTGLEHGFHTPGAVGSNPTVDTK